MVHGLVLTANTALSRIDKRGCFLIYGLISARICRFAKPISARHRWVIGAVWYSPHCPTFLTATGQNVRGNPPRKYSDVTLASEFIGDCLPFCQFRATLLLVLLYYDPRYRSLKAPVPGVEQYKSISAWNASPNQSEKTISNDVGGCGSRSR